MGREPPGSTIPGLGNWKGTAALAGAFDRRLEASISDRERKTRERAHQIWEQEGRPAGREREHWERAAREIEDEEAGREGTDRGAMDDRGESPAASVGAGSGLQPGGTSPGGGTGAGAGSIGTRGGSTGGAATGAARKRRR